MLECFFWTTILPLRSAIDSLGMNCARVTACSATAVAVLAVRGLRM
jgi:hypothetical protein